MVLIVILLVVAPLFFYRLGVSSLVSWDEAWYAEVARQIGVSGNWLVMSFNNMNFFDHPPVGFWLIHIGQTIFGINELGSRVMGGVFGLVAVAGTYLLGKKLFGGAVGVFSALALVSAPWFLLRVRSGNLDIFLVAGMVWTIYLAYKARENRRWFWAMMPMFIFTMMTKTMAPFLILPGVLVALWGVKLPLRWMLIGVGLVVSAFLVWGQTNYAASDVFWRRYVAIGTPGVGKSLEFLDQVKLIKDNIYNGIGRWFWPAVAGVILGVMSLQRRFVLLFVVCCCLVGPYVLSGKSQLWHLIPVQPFLLIALMGCGYVVVNKIFKSKTWLATAGLAVMFVLIGLPLVQRSWQETVLAPAYKSDEQILSEAARGYEGKIYVDETFVPAVVFYSRKQAQNVIGPLEEVFAKSPSPFLVITYDWRLSSVDESKYLYEVVKRDRDKVLVYVERR